MNYFVIPGLVVNSSLNPRTFEGLKEMILKHYPVNWQQIQSKCRDRELIKPRHLLCWLVRYLTGMELRRIGIEIGNRDHSTIIHALKAVNDQLIVDEEFRSDVDDMLSLYSIKLTKTVNYDEIIYKPE